MANSQPYLIPFGVDPRQFFKGLNDMDTGVDQLATNATQAGKEMQKAFEAPGVAAANLGKLLDADTAKALNLRNAAQTLGKDLNTALSSPGATNVLEQRLEKVNKLITSAVGKPVKFNIDFDKAKLQEFEKMLVEGGNELRVLAGVVDFAREKLKTLAPDTPEFTQLTAEIQKAEGFLKDLGEAAEQSGGKQMSLRAQLRILKEELSQMELAGKDNTQEFINMAVAAGKLEDQMGDVSARVRVLASDTRYLDAGIQAVTGLAGAFAAAQGAAALFGSENEAINEVIQKTTGAMAILQGLQAIATALNKDQALSVLFLSRARATDATATVAQTGATVAQTGATVAATTATRGLTAALLANPITAIIVGLVAAVAAIYAFTSGTDEAEEATKALNAALEQLDHTLAVDIAAVEQGTAVRVAMAKKLGKSESEITEITRGSLEERLKLQRQYTKDADALVDAAILRGAKQAEVDPLLKKANESFAADNRLLGELEVKRIEGQTQAQKERSELSKKGIEDSKKRAEEERAILEQQIKFRREYSAAYADAIFDGYEKEKEQARQSINNKIEDLEREKNLSAAAEKEKNEVIAQLRRNLSQTLFDIDKKRETDLANLRFEGRTKIAELQADSTFKEIQLLNLGYEARVKEIKEQFKNESALRTELLNALEANRAREEKKIRDSAAVAALGEMGERAALEVETAARFIGDFKNIEEKKQVEVLKVRLDFARRAEALLISQGNTENSLVVLQARKAVRDLEKTLGDAQKDLRAKGGFDLMEALGLGKLTTEQQDAVKRAAQQSLQSITEISGFIVSQYQRQIDAKQKVIDQENDDIRTLEDLLEEEKGLRADGFANNVATVEAELAEKKRQRDQDVKDQEEIQKKQNAIQRAQIALDTATQVSGLITSATNIFKSLSPLGPIGVGLAIGTIALMVGAFTAAKIKAFQAVGNTQKFEKGGWIDGESHARGGKKYMAADGSGDVVELEGGEHVTRKSQAAKYADLLEAINNDRLAGMNDDALRAMLNELGIHLQTNTPADTVTMARERDAARREAMLHPGNDIGGAVNSINHNVAYLADRERFKPHRWEEGEFNCITQGNETIKIPK